MVRILLVVANKGFQSQELKEPYLAVKKAGFDVDLASPQGGTAISDAEETVDTIPLQRIDEKEYDGVVFIGGPGSQPYLTNNKEAQNLAEKFAEANKIVAGICHGTLVLAYAGLLKDVPATTYYDAIGDLLETGADYVNSEVAESIDGQFITAKGPDSAKDFGKALVYRFKEMKTASKLQKISSSIIEGCSQGPVYYHTSSKKYNSGDIIKPYWSLDQPNRDVENTFERLREKSCSSCPSRFNSVFTWPTLEDAKRDLVQFIGSGRPRYLYQVSPLGRIRKCDMGAYVNACLQGTGPSWPETDLNQLAQQYWFNDLPLMTEILLEGGAKVIDILRY